MSKPRTAKKSAAGKKRRAYVTHLEHRLAGLEETVRALQTGRIASLERGIRTLDAQRADLFPVRCVVHDFYTLAHAIGMSTSRTPNGLLRSCQTDEREAALTHWRGTGTWPAWLLEELGLGQVAITAESTEPRKDV